MRLCLREEGGGKEKGRKVGREGGGEGRERGALGSLELELQVWDLCKNSKTSQLLGLLGTFTHTVVSEQVQSTHGHG